MGGAWAVRANQFGRIAALILLALFGLTLLFSSLAERLSRPLVRLGGRLSGQSETGRRSGPILCAGHCHRAPVDALRRADSGADFDRRGAERRERTDGDPAAGLCGGRSHFACGRAAGRRAGLRGDEAVAGRGALGAADLGRGVLAGVAAVAFGLDRGILTRLSLAGTSDLEQRLIDRLRSHEAERSGHEERYKPAMMMMSSGGEAAGAADDA